MMRRALELAQLGLNTTDPNPRVGCVLVQEGRIVGEGWHQRAGEAHAEVYALRAAGERARGATAYVTLEPCSHTGRTPPCTDALIRAGVARVVYAVGDPDPRVNGTGAAALRAAGIEVRAGMLADEAEALNVGFFRRMRSGLPWIRVKLAASLDARIALANGESRWITGTAARTDVQRYRARSSAILTGSGTVKADDPQLDVRLPETTRQPLRVVLDSELAVAPSARIFARPGAVVFTASTAADRRAELERRGVRIERARRSAAGGLELEPVLRQLAALEVNELWVEAGAGLAGALLEGNWVDELVVYLAPCLLGPAARPLVELPPLQRLDQKLQLEFIDCSRIGEDLRLIARPRRERR